MKFLLSFILFSSTCMAQEFKLVYRMPNTGETLRLTLDADTYEEVIIKGAFACKEIFKKVGRLNEDRILDIVDACANPRDK